MLKLTGCCFLTLSVVFSSGYSQDNLDSERSEEKDTSKTYFIDEVVVTATRTAKRIIDVPYSIELVQPSQFRYERKTSVDNILGMIPGLFFQNRYGNHDVRISIRGFGSRSNSGIRGVRILLDGIPESEPDGQTRIEAIDFQSVGSIEIVKGNSSSLYTNAPGGVINFINDINFTESFALQFNEFGSFGLRSNGFKTGVKSKNYKFLTTYNYHHAKGFRQHSEDYWHILNTVLQTNPGDDSRLHLYGYFVDGIIRLPGSLTKQDYDADPFQANSRDIGRDAKRITRKGRLGLQYDTFLDEDNNNELQLTGYGTIKYFERTARTYRVINRTGLGATVRFVNHSEIFGLKNEFTVGTDLLHQTGPVEEYVNISGKKGDNLLGLIDETIANIGFYFQNTITLIDKQLDLLVSGRYDKVAFDQKNQILEIQNAIRRFEAFTPKAAFNFKITPTVAAYTSYGLSFDSPAGNEMDNPTTSTNPFATLLNPDLQPQKSKNFELGIKGNIVRPMEEFLRNVYFDFTFFNSIIDDEIVPFEMFGEVFFRNAARTTRRGLELGANVEVLKGLKWRAAYTLSDFKYDLYTARSIELDTLGNVATIDRSFGGNIVPSVPKLNFSVSLSYEHELASNTTGFVKGTYTNVCGMYTDDGNSDKTKGYQLLSSTLGLDLIFNGFNILVSGGANNIFNLTYVAFININSAQGEFYEVGEPRHYFFSVNLGYTF